MHRSDKECIWRYYQALTLQNPLVDRCVVQTAAAANRSFRQNVAKKHMRPSKINRFEVKKDNLSQHPLQEGAEKSNLH